VKFGRITATGGWRLLVTQYTIYCLTEEEGGEGLVYSSKSKKKFAKTNCHGQRKSEASVKRRMMYNVYNVHTVLYVFR
jgi:hypothetical protein